MLSTGQEHFADANERLKKYKALDFMADALERDPSKIHDVRGALEGRRPERHDPAPPAPPPNNGPKTVYEAVKAMPADKRAELDAMDPVEREAAMADLAQQLAERSIANSTAPIVEATVDSAIANFKLSKASDQTYKFAASHFDEEMSDFDKRQFYQMTPEGRKRELELRWGMAEAKVLRSSLAKSTPRSPRNVGGGGGGGGGSAPSRSGPSGKIPRTWHGLRRCRD